MDEIVLTGMQFYARHGVMVEETKLGQRFLVDVALRLNLRQAGQTDSVMHTVDYSQVFLAVQSIVEGPPKKLIEAVAQQVAVRLLTDFTRLESVRVTVRKPSAPVPGIFETVCVHVERDRRDLN